MKVEIAFDELKIKENGFNKLKIFENIKENFSRYNLPCMADDEVMNDIKYKVVLKLKSSLKADELDYIKKYIEQWQNKFNIINIADDTYCLDKNFSDKYNDFGSVSLFYANMLEKKEYMEQLEYYDFEDGECDYAI